MFREGRSVEGRLLESALDVLCAFGRFPGIARSYLLSAGKFPPRPESAETEPGPGPEPEPEPEALHLAGRACDSNSKLGARIKGYELADYESDQAMSSGRGALRQACRQLPCLRPTKKPRTMPGPKRRAE